MGNSELEPITKGEGINELLDVGILEFSSSLDVENKTVTFGRLVVEDDYVPAGVVESSYESNKYKLKERVDKSTVFLPTTNTQIFQIASIRIELDSAEQVIREKGYYQLTDVIKYYDDDKTLKINNHIIKMPDNCNITIGKESVQFEIIENPLRMMDVYCKFYVEYGPDLFRLMYESYKLELDSKNSNLFIDHRGNITFNYNEGIAVINVINDVLKLGKYEVNLLGEDRYLQVNGKWVRLNRNVAMNGIDGILKMGKNKIKLPAESYISSTVDGANIYIRDRLNGSVVQLNAIYQGDNIEFRNNTNSIQMKKASKVVLDRSGIIFFDYEGISSLISLKTKMMQVGMMSVFLYDGESIKVTGKWIHLNEVTSINPEAQTIKYGKSKMLVQGLVDIFPGIKQMELKIKDRHIFCIPRNKQLFIRVGGKLIIITITVGIAIDQNGNLSFDHGGYFATLDTNFMVLDIDTVRMNMGNVAGICVEFIGNTVIVSTQDHQRNFLELLQNQISQKGIATLISNLTQSEIDISELIDMILNRGGDILKLLRDAGIQLNAETMEKLQKLLGNNILSELMTSEGNTMDMNQLMCLSLNPDELMNLMLAGQNIALPSSEEIIKMVLSSGSMENILAKVKGKNIDLLTA